MIAFAVIGWMLFVALGAFFLGAKIVSNAQEARCKERGLCSGCLLSKDLGDRMMSKMFVEEKSDENKA